MFDCFVVGLVSFFVKIYDFIFVLIDFDGSCCSEVFFFLFNREIWGKVVLVFKVGGILRSEDGSLGQGNLIEEKEVILVGLVLGDDGYIKFDYVEQEVVFLWFGVKKVNVDGSVFFSFGKKVVVVLVLVLVLVLVFKGFVGVGFIDFSDDLDFDVEDDDDVIDEDIFLIEVDLKCFIQQFFECVFQLGKKRRVCKDWYVFYFFNINMKYNKLIFVSMCGFVERIVVEDKVCCEKVEKGFVILKFKFEDFSEFDFIVQGKIGFCNSCYFGDVFRCVDCFYIGFFVFKFGE